MIDTRTFLRLPLNFKDKCKIYPPAVEDVFGNEHFGLYRTLFTMSQEDIQDEFVKKQKEVEKFPTPLEYLLSNAYYDKKVEQIIKDGFKFFIHEEVNFIYDSKVIIIGDLEEALTQVKKIEDLRMISEDNYFDFQNLIRISLGEKAIELPKENEDPRIAKMKAKARYRDRIKAKKGTAGGVSYQTTLEALCCMGIGLSPLNVGQVSYAAVGPLMSRCQLKDKYETDIRSLQAGAKSNKVHPVYWIKDDI